MSDPRHAPARPGADDPRLVPLLRRLGYNGEEPPVDLGGTMSLNLHLPHRQAVLRIHHRTESRTRILGLRQLRRQLSEAGLTVGAPLPLDGGEELARWNGHWVQLEVYVEHTRPPATWNSYIWLFVAAGRLHRVLRETDPHIVPRPSIATYGPPSSLRRWLAVTRTVAGDEAGERVAARLEGLIRRLARQWRPASQLPRHLVHGDLRLGNAVLTGAGQTAYLDFGFAALRPRIHELAYSLFWVILRPDGSGTGAEFDWSRVPQFVEAYEEGLRDRLSPTERAALGPYLAAVPLYFGAIAGFTADPAGHLDGELPSIRIAEWVLDHPVLP